MANRARKTRVTKASRIRKYLEDNPNTPPTQVAKALKISVHSVHSTMHTDKLRRGIVKKNNTFTIEEVMVVNRLGVEKVKAIIKLLEAVQWRK